MSNMETVATTGIHFAAAVDQEVFPFRPVRMQDGAPMHPTFSDHFVIGKLVVEPGLLLEVANDISGLPRQVNAEKVVSTWKTHEAPLPPRLESFIESCGTLVHDYVMGYCDTPVDTRQTATIGPYEYDPAVQWHRDNGNDPYVTTFRTTLLGPTGMLAEGWFKKRHFSHNRITSDVHDIIRPGLGWVIATNGLTTVHRPPYEEHAGEMRLTTSLEVQHVPITTLPQ